MSAVEDLRWISAQVPVDLADAFKKLADEHDRSVSAELRRAMKRHLDAEVTGERSAA